MLKLFLRCLFEPLGVHGLRHQFFFAFVWHNQALALASIFSVALYFNQTSNVATRCGWCFYPLASCVCCSCESVRVYRAPNDYISYYCNVMILLFIIIFYFVLFFFSFYFIILIWSSMIINA